MIQRRKKHVSINPKIVSEIQIKVISSEYIWIPFKLEMLGTKSMFESAWKSYHYESYVQILIYLLRQFI